MTIIETQLLSKVLDEKNFAILDQYKIDISDFPTLSEVYNFIRSYVREQKQTPDFRSVLDHYPDFDYQPGIYDSFDYLCSSLKSQSAKRQAYELLQHQASKKFQELDGKQFAEWLKTEADRIYQNATAGTRNGTDYAKNKQERRKWYEEIKNNKAKLFIPTPYPSLNTWLGGFELGDYVLLMAYTNKGKSWIASHIGLTAWQKGFGVLHYSPELSKKQQIFRLDTLNNSVSNAALNNGELGMAESVYFEYLNNFKESDVPYLVKTMEDLPNGLDIETIEADIQANKLVKMVIIDGFGLMTVRNRQMRDGMTFNSRRLRQLFGKYNVVGLVTHQTPTSYERRKGVDESGGVIIDPPDLTEYSETIATIQDASTVLSFDQGDGIGKIKLCKSRKPYVGGIFELQINFNYGVIKEVTVCDHF